MVLSQMKDEKRNMAILLVLTLKYKDLMLRFVTGSRMTEIAWIACNNNYAICTQQTSYCVQR